MKINKFIIGIVITASMMFGACEDFEDTEKMSPEVPAGCQGVYFPASNVGEFEMEPTDPTEITLNIARSISTGAVDVPIVVEVNDEDVYNVPETVSFAEGDTLVSFKVTFPDADEGITYKLRLAVEGDTYVNPYGSQKPYVATQVTRVKWTEVPDPMVYVDGTFNTLFSLPLGSLPMYVEAEKAEFTGMVRYRFKNAYDVPTGGPDADGIYDGFPYNDPGDFDESKDYYTVIEINTNTNEVFMPAHDIGVDWGYGMCSIGNVYRNLSDDKDSYPLGKLENDIITFPASSLFFSMADYEDGGKYVADVPTKIYLSKDIFIASNLEIDDFNEVGYEVVDGEVGIFKSEAMDDRWDQNLEKAIDIDPENEDSDYKNLYYFPDLYESDYGLAFYYEEGGAFTIPEAQPIGMEFLGNEVFVSQSDSIQCNVEVNESLDVTVYTLGLIFHYEDGTIVGEFAEKFYYSEDAVSFSIENFVGEYNLTGTSLLGSDPADMDVEIALGDNSNELVITGVNYAEKIIATFSDATSTMTIAPQELPDYNGITGLYLYTFDGGPSTTSTIDLTMDVIGEISITPSSVGFGYLITDNPAQGYYPSYYNLVFTPISAKSAAVSQQSVSSEFSRSQINYVERVDVQEKPEPNFKVGGKISPKKVKKNISNEIVF